MPNHVIWDRLWESRKLERCSDQAAAWYPWIFLVCDDEGRFEYHPRAIWASVFRRRPSVSQEDVENWLAQYDHEGLLVRYHVDGGLAFWTNFKGKKPSERRPSQFPDPLQFPSVKERLAEIDAERHGRANTATKPRKRRAQTAGQPRKRRPQNRIELNGIERNGNGSGVAGAPPSSGPLPEPDTPPKLKGWSTEAGDDWQERFQCAQEAVPFGEIGRYLGPLVQRLTWPIVRPAWNRFLREEQPKFVRPKLFAEKPGPWLNGTVARVALPARPTAADTTISAVHQIMSEEASRDRSRSVQRGLGGDRPAAQPALTAGEAAGLPRGAGGGNES